VNQDGIPFVYDVGTGHYALAERGRAEQAALGARLSDDRPAMPAVTADGAAALEDDVIAALAAIKQANPAEYQTEARGSSRRTIKFRLAALDRAVKSQEGGEGHCPDAPRLCHGAAG
jgi:hypothetical protein